jgi:tRNA-dihydrouridine synthase 1
VITTPKQLLGLRAPGTMQGGSAVQPGCAVKFDVQEERKRKREEKRERKALKAQRTEDKKKSCPWMQEKDDGDQAEEPDAGARKRKRRGWMTRLGERDGVANLDEIDFDTYFVPSEQDLSPCAPHWSILKTALSNLQKSAQEMDQKPSWAWTDKEADGKRICTGPVLASVLKCEMKKIALAQDPDKPFNEQDLKFRSFSAFLDHAKAHTICLVKCQVHRGNVWVDHAGHETRLPTLESIQERDQQDRDQLGTNAASLGSAGVQLVAGKARSKTAKYQVIDVPAGGADSNAQGVQEIGSVDRPLKLSSWALWDAMKKPKFVCAPMVEQSELPFRLLCRKYGTTLAYTPMFHARLFLEDSNYRAEQFTTCPADRPLVVQFCANDPDIFAAAARMVEGQCDAVDLNLGCPQGIAKKGHYGSFLMDDMELIYKLVHTAHTRCKVAISAKMRVFDDDARSLQYAKMLQDAGAQIITVHGRTRENKGASGTPADWGIIRKIKEFVTVPVISNGNIVTYGDVMRCLEQTKADAVMSAEWLRRNPALFAGEEEQHKDVVELVEEYLELCARYPCPVSFMRSHCFKMLMQHLNAHPDMRSSFVDAKTRVELQHCTKRLRERIQEANGT